MVISILFWIVHVEAFYTRPFILDYTVLVFLICGHIIGHYHLWYNVTLVVTCLLDSHTTSLDCMSIYVTNSWNLCFTVSSLLWYLWLTSLTSSFIHVGIFHAYMYIILIYVVHVHVHVFFAYVLSLVVLPCIFIVACVRV